MAPKKKKVPAPVKGKKGSAGAGSSASGKKKKKVESSSEEDDDDDDDDDDSEEDSDEDEVRLTRVHMSLWIEKPFRSRHRPRYTKELRSIGSGRPINFSLFSRGVKEKLKK